MESNITTYYEALVYSLAKTATTIHNEGTEDRTECVSKAIDERFYKSCDMAYVLAHGFLEGYITWGKENMPWTALGEVLWNDVYEETLEEWED